MTSGSRHDGTEVRVPSLFEAVTRSLTSRTRAARRERLEVGLGVMLFFCVAAVASTIAAELRGDAALREAVVSLLFLGPTFLVYRMWRRAA